MSNEPLSSDTLYKELYVHLRATDDVSFKLLGIVPLISGTGILTLFWGKDTVPPSVVSLLALFAAVVTLGLYRWELRNIDVCWWLAERIGAIESRWATQVNADKVMSRKLSELRPPLGIDKPQAEAAVYGMTILVWLIVPWLHHPHPLFKDPATTTYVGAAALVALLAAYSIVDSLRTHHWPAKAG